MAFYWDYDDRCERMIPNWALARGDGPRWTKARKFNDLIDRTIEELTMSDAAFNAIKRVFKARFGQMTSHEAVQVILDVSRDYLSDHQALELMRECRPFDEEHDHSENYWGKWYHWMNALKMEGFVGCPDSKPKRMHAKHPADVLGHPAYPQTYFGLDWDKTYTYVEARSLIAKELIDGIGKNLAHPMRLARNGESDSAAIIAQLHERAQLRPAGLRGWGRLIKLAPLIGRWSLYLKQIYLEVSLRPDTGSKFSACHDRFAQMAAESECPAEASERAVRQRVA